MKIVDSRINFGIFILVYGQQQPATPYEPVACPHCFKTISSSYNLKRHIEEVHTEKPRELWDKCDQCGNQFKSRSQLTKHRYTVHGIRSRQPTNYSYILPSNTPTKT